MTNKVVAQKGSAERNKNMTYEAIKNFFCNEIDTILVGTDGKEIMESKKGEEITLVYKNRQINNAVIDWENRCLKLITDDELTYRENNILPYKATVTVSDDDDENFYVTVVLEDGKQKTFPYWLNMASEIPDSLCYHTIINGRDYYFG